MSYQTEKQRLQQLLDALIPVVKRQSDAQGDRVQVTQNNQHIEIPIASSQISSASKIK